VADQVAMSSSIFQSRRRRPSERASAPAQPISSLPRSLRARLSVSSLPAWTDRRPGRRQTHDHRAQRGAARRARNAPRADRTRQICPTLRLTAAFGPKRAGGPRRKTISARRKSASECVRARFVSQQDIFRTAYNLGKLLKLKIFPSQQCAYSMKDQYCDKIWEKRQRT